MKAILVPTDFSTNANTAIVYACELAKSRNASVIVLNTYFPATTQPNVINPLIDEEIKMVETSAEEQLASIRKMVKENYPHIHCYTKFMVGGIIDAIETLINQDKVDLVVMGTRGATGLTKMLFGSNTTRVIEKVKCPVLAIPMDCPFQIPKRIIYATDFNKSELNHLQELVAIAAAFDAELMMTHITTDKSALQSEEMLKRHFSKQVSEHTDYARITYFAKYEEDISRALESFAQQVDADWIALLTRERSLFQKLYDPSLTKRMAYQTKIPLLAIKN